jgi:hypothetical protein
VVEREMGSAELMSTADSGGAELARIMVCPDVATARQALRRGLARVAVLDSLQRLDPAELAELDAGRLEGSWLVISQVNAEGRKKGTTDEAHAASLVLEVLPEEAGTARVTLHKTRLGGPSGGSEVFELAPKTTGHVGGNVARRGSRRQAKRV